MEKLPEQGFTFWPVGNGDSTTISVSKNINLQVDINHLVCSENDDDDRTPVIEKLVEHLPKVDGDPYLSVFALTHPDRDHCCGFEELLKQVTIGELWLTPRIFEEFEEEEFCDDALIFLDEAMRRVRKTIKVIGNGGTVEAGDRVRIIGYSERLKEDAFEGFPENLLTIPGHTVTMLDGQDCSSLFGSFIHAPFKSDADGDRNDTSLAMQITLSNGKAKAQALLFGDHCYLGLNRIFKISKKETLNWNIFLAPHHCSKSAMYYDDGNGEKLQQHILDAFKETALPTGYIISSSHPFPEENNPGDNPPHIKARHEYEEIVPTEFLCTGEIAPSPIVFQFTTGGIQRVQLTEAKKQPSIQDSVKQARGGSEPAKTVVGFGNR